MTALALGVRWAQHGATGPGFRDPGGGPRPTPGHRRLGQAAYLGLALMLLFPLQTTAASAGGLRINGEVAAETRLFPRSPVFPDQANAHLSPSLVFAPEFYYESGNRDWQLLGEGFVRIDAHDGSRSHIDIRELGLQYSSGRITAFFGLGKVFWGVTEALHLVDIVNQTDGVEGLDNEDKLGQPMIALTVERDWGSLDFFYLPYFRKRTFPAADARLRGPFPVSTHAVFESDQKRWSPGFALRWFRTFARLDVGLSAFRGTAPEPRLVPGNGNTGRFALVPHYDRIGQLGIDFQWTGESTLFKFEGITRGGHGARLAALTAGLEHTLHQPFASNGDLGLLVELMLDSRNRSAPPTLFDRDLFIGARWALNDVNSTSLLGGPIVDLATGELLLLVEGERRVGTNWRINVDVRLFDNTDSASAARGLRRDSYVSLSLHRFF